LGRFRIRDGLKIPPWLLHLEAAHVPPDIRDRGARFVDLERDDLLVVR
jgi:hypothetical protein